MQEYSDIPIVLKDFLVYMEVILGKSERTTKEYYYDLRTFFRYLQCKNGRASFDDFDSVSIASVTIDDLKAVTRNDLYEYMYYISSTRKNAQNARARKVSSLRSYFKYLTAKTGLLTDNPAKELDSPKIPDLLPKYLTLDESKKMLDNIESQYPERDYAILTLFLNCGLRLSELVGTNLRDYDGEKLRVFGKGAKERIIYLNTACQTALNQYLQVRPHENVKDKNALFLSRNHSRLSGKMVQVIVKRALESAGLDTTRYSTHKLRHTAATLMYRYGNVDVRALQEVLGHAQLSTTQIYTHVDSERLKEATASNPRALETNKSIEN